MLLKKKLSKPLTISIPKLHSHLLPASSMADTGDLELEAMRTHDYSWHPCQVYFRSLVLLTTMHLIVHSDYFYRNDDDRNFYFSFLIISHYRVYLA